MGGGLVAAAQNVRAGVSMPESQRTVISTTIDILDAEGNNIGYITNFTPSHTRNVTRIRHLNSMDAGRILEIAVGPSDVNVSIGGFALYNQQDNGSLIQRLGGGSTRKAMRMLEEQKIPFTIVFVETHPVTKVKTAIDYAQCWLTNYSSPKNIGTVTIAETASLAVSWVEDHEGETESVDIETSGD